MSEIKRIHISRCPTVSRLDRIRRLWLSMLPLGVWNVQRCVASSSTGCRSIPGPCPVCSVDEALFRCVARRFMNRDLGWKSKEGESMRNYIIPTQKFMEDCSMSLSVQCAWQWLKKYRLLFHCHFLYLCVLYSKFSILLTFEVVVVWHLRDIYSCRTAQAFLSDVISTSVTLT